MTTVHLFVYGTLLRAFRHPRHILLAEHARLEGRAFIQGELFEVSGYPGMVRSDVSDRRVVGELYRLLDPDHVLTALDAYEECSPAFPEPHEYVRQALPVTRPDGSTETAWLYLYQWDTARLEPIPSGDYLAYRTQRSTV